MTAECVNCGKRYGDSLSNCSHCNEPNPDFVPRGERFNTFVKKHDSFQIVEGVLVKIEVDD